MNIFLTGGSRGIGRATVIRALELGHKVAFTYRNPGTDTTLLHKELQQVASPDNFRAYKMDVSKALEVAEVCDKVIEDFDTIDCVVNNAGINRDNLAFHMTDEEWDEVLQTNLTGPFYVVRQFLPAFLANGGGRFVHLSSIAKDGLSGQANYAASKAGLIGLSGTIAKEYGRKGITSNVVVPGMFETPMTQSTLSHSLKSFWLQHCPLKRMGLLDEVANVILFLGSPEASFVNGQAINVNGGLDWAE